MATGFTKGTGKIGHTLFNFKKCLTATLAFVSGSSSSPGFLSVGLISGIGGISGYVIEWHLNSPTGSIVFKSGLNPQEAVNAIHPFVNEPVTSGNLYAVVKYIIIDGIKYSSYINLGQYSPDLKLCFNYISVAELNCSNGVSGVYSHTFTYVNNLDPVTLASRTIRFNLDSNVKYLAVYLNAFDVVDRVNITHYHSDGSGNTVLTDWHVGTNGTVSWTAPKRYCGTWRTILKTVFNIPTYQAGDYLLINITPRILDPTNLNTNWTLSLKCFSTFGYEPPVGWNDIILSSFRFYWLQSTCSWVFAFKTTATYNPPQSTFAQYLPERFMSSSWFTKDANLEYTASLRWTTQVGYQGFNVPPCVANTANINMSKNSNIVVLTFTDIADYNRFYTYFTAALTSYASYISTYTSDGTKATHYLFYHFKFRIANTCGDAYTDKVVIFHYTSQIAWDSNAKTVTFTMLNTVDTYIPPTGCVTYNGYPAQLITACASSISEASYSLNSLISWSLPFGFQQIRETVTKPLTGSYRGLHASENPAQIEFTPFPSCWKIITSTSYGAELCYYEFFITNETDPANNFKVLSWLDSAGNLLPSKIRIFDLVNGVQLIPDILSLSLEWDNITNVPVLDVNSLANWNTLFNLPTKGGVFTGVSVSGNIVTLTGGSEITLKDDLFLNNTHLVNITDLGSVIAAGHRPFKGTTSLVSASFPSLTLTNTYVFENSSLSSISAPKLVSIGNYTFRNCVNLTSVPIAKLIALSAYAFEGCTGLRVLTFNSLLSLNSGTQANLFKDSGVTELHFPLLTIIGISGTNMFGNIPNIAVIDIPKCATLGGSVLANHTFLPTVGKTIDLTIPASLMTCNGGNPDGDIAYLIANNTVTIHQI